MVPEKYFYCKIDECSRLLFSSRNNPDATIEASKGKKGMCSKHYQRFRRFGENISLIRRTIPEIIIYDDIGYVPLTHGMFTIIDAEDVKLVETKVWFSVSSGNTFYARSNISSGTIAMHRLILNLNPKENIIDHINRNGLDNRKSNLRIVTNSQNQINRTSRTDIPKGVRQTSRGTWVAAARINKKLTHLGTFSTAYEAALAYDKVVYSTWGDNAYLNYPEDLLLDND